MKPVLEWDEEYVISLPSGEYDWMDAKTRRGIDLTCSGAEVSTDVGLTKFNVYFIPSNGSPDTQIGEGRPLFWRAIWHPTRLTTRSIMRVSAGGACQ